MNTHFLKTVFSYISLQLYKSVTPSPMMRWLHVALLAMFGCGGPDVSGTWCPVYESESSCRNGLLKLTQDDDEITGKWCEDDDPDEHDCEALFDSHIEGDRVTMHANHNSYSYFWDLTLDETETELSGSGSFKNGVVSGVVYRKQ